MHHGFSAMTMSSNFSISCGSCSFSPIYSKIYCGICYCGMDLDRFWITPR